MRWPETTVAFTVRNGGCGTLHFRRVAFFDVHIFELAGLEDLAALKALDEFGVLVTRDDRDARVAARLWHGVVERLGGLVGQSDRIHTEARERGEFLAECGVFFNRRRGLSSGWKRNLRT
ncbi:hypothetical protein Acid345_0487 [Candidatus Koribacter versatilis Ellin345]|uniref:Uncharacterized protein n=1 Tax=Koribacter versatilis (strain Ellin345) TaxID=204669 RepID=Q1IUF8_KORVE|nr:hypothetical protein Acid345_0487 [Candidatus Koribacter versatilis Ellin345]